MLTRLFTKRPDKPVVRSCNEILQLSASSEEKCRLEALPPELLFEIVSYMPLESQACLATCSRTLATQLGTQYWFSLRRTESGDPSNTLWHYLQLLKRDRPSLYCCHSCLCLHSLDIAKHPEPTYVDFNRHHRFTLLNEPRVSLSTNTLYLVRFYDLQLAKARYLHGGCPSGRLDTLRAMDDATGYGTFSSLRETKVFQMEARMAGGHLLIRSQNLLLLDLSKKSAREAGYRLSFALCQHFQTDMRTRSGLYFENKELRRLVECPNDHNAFETNNCQDCGFSSLCPYCPTEMSLQKLKIPSTKLLAVAATQWRDMGTVETREDLAWRLHPIYHYIPELDSPYWEYKRLRAWMDPKLELMNIRQRFEREPGVTLEELTAANLVKLGRCNSVPYWSRDWRWYVDLVVKNGWWQGSQEETASI